MITTKRTIYYPLDVTDFEEILEMYTEKDTFKYIKPLEGKTRKFYEQFLEKKIKLNSPHIGFWTVREKESEKLIGTVNLNFVPNTELIQIGCHLKRKFWNQGYATELMQSLLIHAFDDRKLERVYGVFEETNQVSKKLLDKLNFSPFENHEVDGSNLYVYRLEKECYYA